MPEPFAIPFSRPYVVGTEQAYIAQTFAKRQLAGEGPFTLRCQALLERELPEAKVLLTPSCTHALEMAALLLEIKPGDDVIVPSFTFASTVNAFVLRGANPVFIDIRPDTLNLDETQLERHITRRTKAIFPVHYAGVGCEMDAIMSIARQYKIPLVEDNAHGLFGKYRGRELGTFGCLAALSFHETKNLTCGEGGALVLSDRQFTERAEVLREMGTNRSRFFRGLVDKYTWIDVGSNYRLSEILAAFLYAQLEAREQIQRQRQQLWECYYTGLQTWARSCEVQLPQIPLHCEQTYHLFYLVLPSPEHRQDLMAHLRAHGIASTWHYLPLHLSEMGRRFGGRKGECPVTEAVSERLLRLPFYTDLTAEDQQRVIETIESVEW